MQQQDIIAPAPATAPIITTAIAEYSTTASALGELRGKYERVIFPVETTKGMKDAIGARAELRNLRVGLDKLRKEIKGPALERCRLIDAEAKDITAKLEALEDPIDRQIKDHEKKLSDEKAARERAEAERIAAIQGKINLIRNIPLAMAGEPASEFDVEITNLRAFVPGDEFAELKGDAIAAANAAIVTLLGMQEKQVAIEAAAARAEADRLAAAETARLAQVEAQRVADELADANRKAAEDLARQRAELAEQEAERKRIADAEQHQRDLVAAETKRQLDAQQAEIAAKRKADEDKFTAERAQFEAERKAFADQQAAAAKAKADEDAAIAKAADDRASAEQAELDRITADEKAEQERTEANCYEKGAAVPGVDVSAGDDSTVLAVIQINDDSTPDDRHTLFKATIRALLLSHTADEIRKMLEDELAAFDAISAIGGAKDAA